MSISVRVSTVGARHAVPLLLTLVAGVVFAGSAGPVGAAETGAAPDTTRQVRSPRRAMLRSLALPGWGQFYNRRVIKGSMIAAAEVGSVAAFFVRRNQINKEWTADAPPRRNIYFFTTLGIVFYSMVDAYVDAHLDGVDWGGVEAGVGEGGAGMKVVLRVRF